MINFDDITKENETKHNQKWLYVPDQPYRTLIKVPIDQKNK